MVMSKSGVPNTYKFGAPLQHTKSIPHLIDHDTLSKENSN